MILLWNTSLIITISGYLSFTFTFTHTCTQFLLCPPIFSPIHSSFTSNNSKYDLLYIFFGINPPPFFFSSNFLSWYFQFSYCSFLYPTSIESIAQVFYIYIIRRRVFLPFFLSFVLFSYGKQKRPVPSLVIFLYIW